MMSTTKPDDDAAKPLPDDDLTPVRARKCAMQGCETIITCGAGAPIFCPEHDELNP